MTLRTCIFPLLLLTGCALPTVNIETPEPVKVDINVRLDVYQHGSESPAPDTTAAAEQATPAASTADVEVRRRNRMGDIQMFKNSRIVGENRRGLLDVRNLPPGEFGDYVSKTVTEENADRMAMMRAMAEQKSLPLAGVQTEQARLWRERSFGGEWIEEPDGSGGWRWAQKGQD